VLCCSLLFKLFDVLCHFVVSLLLLLFIIYKNARFPFRPIHPAGSVDPVLDWGVLGAVLCHQQQFLWCHSKCIIFFDGGACVRRRGAPVPWHSEQFRSV